jgi:hypothetical protein
MKHVKLDAQEESIKRFVLGLTVDPGGSVLELNGKAVACVIPPPKSVRGDSTAEEWTEKKNNRRCDLIDREIDGTLTPVEAVELQELQEEMLRYRHRVAPLPLEDARKLHQELLARAAAKTPKP